jgi:ganglioside-induced differentiation-associated protein 1
MLVLYHSTASVAAAKARLVLHEKNLEWQGEILDLQRGGQNCPEYVRLNPNAVVSTLVHDGRAVIESTVIMQYLEEAFPAAPLLPAEPYGRALARLWLKKIDDSLHGSCAMLTFAIVFRRFLVNKTPAELEARFATIQDANAREARRLAVVQGLAVPPIATALKHYDRYRGEMDETLDRSPYLASDQYSLADTGATPYVYRAEVLGLDRFWIDCRPHLTAWFERVRARPSFERAITGVLTAVDQERFSVPRDETWAAARQIVGR